MTWLSLWHFGSGAGSAYPLVSQGIILTVDTEDVTVETDGMNSVFETDGGRAIMSIEDTTPVELESTGEQSVTVQPVSNAVALKSNDDNLTVAVDNDSDIEV